MLPLHTRVAAIDDNEDHLQKIAWGLGKAGFSPLPFLFSDGKLENAPRKPIPGIRLVFSDIHIVPGGQNNDAVNASNIVKCLKTIVGEGPYALIFWSQFPGDLDRIRPLIEQRAGEQKMTAPLVFAAIDKGEVFTVNAAATGADDQFDANRLRDIILDQIKDYKTLAVASSWDSRVAAAAARTTNQLFRLAGESANRSTIWGQLLAYLACESSGHAKAIQNPGEALDSALLPLLEDQLALISREPNDCAGALSEIAGALVTRPELPKAIKSEELNSSYLIEELTADSLYKVSDRGVVTKLGGAFINSGEFVRAFGMDDGALIRAEFVLTELTLQEKSQVKLHVVEIGPECDHVQGKISTHLYVLALLVPASLLLAKCVEHRKGKILKYRNLSILDSGALSLTGKAEPHHLLISCRCFMALAPKTVAHGEPQFRLRKELLNEVLHQYTTHARRPGVMRF